MTVSKKLDLASVSLKNEGVFLEQLHISRLRGNYNLYFNNTFGGHLCCLYITEP